MIVHQNASILTQGKQTSFKAAGGTEPYTYAISDNKSGAYIDPVTGDYFAGITIATDTITVTDSSVVPIVVTTTISVLTTRHLICDIIQNQLDLTADRVYLWDQKIMQPKDFGLYVAVGVLSRKPFSNSRKTRPDGVSVIQSMNFQESISIDIISRGTDARDRKEEILMALNSVYSQQIQNQNSFFIAPITTQIRNLSHQDGAAIPYRYHIDVTIMYSISKIKTVPYYDDIPSFEFMVDT
jgi:hypothetical protein